MRLTKHHGLGNDFLVALRGSANTGVPTDAASLAALALALCDRRRGVGADGLIVGEVDADGHVLMHLHNADGSRAEMSGNGIRCLGQAVAIERGSNRATIDVTTDAGHRHLRVAPGAAHHEVVVEVSMGRVSDAGEVPEEAATVVGSRQHRYLDVGNPHLVVAVDDPDSVDLASEGPAIEAGFPDGVNVEFIHVADADDGHDPVVTLRVWERGAGITEACGTGACAATFAARGWGMVGDDATVAMVGGRARVHLSGDEAVLTGPSVFVAAIDVPDDVIDGLHRGTP